VNDENTFAPAPERYRYLKVIGENNQRVMVWDDCFTFNGEKDTW
jgi:hypothetical protein